MLPLNYSFLGAFAGNGGNGVSFSVILAQIARRETIRAIERKSGAFIWEEKYWVPDFGRRVLIGTWCARWLFDASPPAWITFFGVTAAAFLMFRRWKVSSLNFIIRAWRLIFLTNNRVCARHRQDRPTSV